MRRLQLSRYIAFLRRRNLRVIQRNSPTFDIKMKLFPTGTRNFIAQPTLRADRVTPPREITREKSASSRAIIVMASVIKSISITFPLARFVLWGTVRNRYFGFRYFPIPCFVSLIRPQLHRALLVAIPFQASFRMFAVPVSGGERFVDIFEHAFEVACSRDFDRRSVFHGSWLSLRQSETIHSGLQLWFRGSTV